MGDTIWDALCLSACINYVESVKALKYENSMNLYQVLFDMCMQLLDSRAPIVSENRALYTLLAYDISNMLNENNLLHIQCAAYADGNFVRFRAPQNEQSRDAWHIERSARLLRQIAPDRPLDDLRAKMQEFVENTPRCSNLC